MQFNLDATLNALNAAAVWVFPRLLEGVAGAEVISFASQQCGLLPTDVIAHANFAVYWVWQLAWVDRVFLDRGLWKWMHRNFTMPNDKKELAKRPHTILLSCFSQMSFDHWSGNISSLSFFGSSVTSGSSSLTSVLGVRQFSYFYIASMYFSGAFDVWVYTPLHAYTRSFIFRRLQPSYIQDVEDIEACIERVSLGASGAVSAVQMLFCLTFPDENLPIQGDEPVPTRQFTKTLVSGDLIPSITSLIGLSSNIGHGAHLGGYAFGALYHGLQEVIIAFQSMSTTTEESQSSRASFSDRSRRADRLFSRRRW
jgi:membrane associated rhomboid family serine protease